MKLLDTDGVFTLWGKVKDHVKTSIDSQQFKTINGIMSASDKAKLDSIAAITDTELKSILV